MIGDAPQDDRSTQIREREMSFQETSQLKESPPQRADLIGEIKS